MNGIADVYDPSFGNSLTLNNSDSDNYGLDDSFDPDSLDISLNPVVNTVADYLDIDADNDGILDFIEAFDFNFDGIEIFHY